MEDKNDDTKAMIPISSKTMSEVMTEPTDDEVLAAQGLLELFQVIRIFFNSCKPENAISTINPFPPTAAIRQKFSHNQRFPTYMSMADLQAIGVNSFGGETGQKPSPTYPHYSPYSFSTEQTMDTDTSAGWIRENTLPPLLPFLSSRLALTSQAEDENTQSVMVKNWEGEGDEEDKEEEKSKTTTKGKFYINISSKQREADISYHRKKVDVRAKLQQYRSD